MRMTPFVLAACLCIGSFVAPPAPLRAQSLEAVPARLQRTAEPRDADVVASPAWWRESRKRFQELALCALASANVTYTLLVGFSGVGTAIGFTAALLGVVMCL